MKWFIISKGNSFLTLELHSEVSNVAVEILNLLLIFLMVIIFVLDIVAD